MKKAQAKDEAKKKKARIYRLRRKASADRGRSAK